MKQAFQPGDYRKLETFQQGLRNRRSLKIRYSFDNSKALGDRVRSKEHPGNVDKQEGYKPLQGLMHRIPLGCEPSGQDTGQAVQKPPQNKGPISSVPETADQEHDHNIDVSPDCSFAVTTQRDIYILGQESG